MRKTLEYLFAGNILTREEAMENMISIGRGLYSEAEFASFLTVFKMRPVTPAELAGFRDAMIELCLAADLSEYQAIDVVGTGGDGKNTFNISTAACFVIAGAGYYVAKHGNYGASSVSGASNVMEYLGYKFSNDKDKLRRDLDKGGFCFLHAPMFHPAMKFISPVRRALKVQTFFNILGPMTNPSSPAYQLLGVNNTEVFDHYLNVYNLLGSNHMIINSKDGYDEVSLTDATIYAMNGETGSLMPEDFGFEPVAPEKLYGGSTVKEAAHIFVSILEGRGTPEQTNVVVSNAALGVKLINPGMELRECVEIALASLHSGRAFHKMKTVVSAQ